MGDLRNSEFNTSSSFTTSGLTVGQTYRIEFLVHQYILNSTQRNMQIYFGSDATGTSTGSFNAALSTGTLATFNFKADTTSQAFFVPGLASNRSTINGVVLSVPEPSSALLGGLGLLALLRRRR